MARTLASERAAQAAAPAAAAPAAAALPAAKPTGRFREPIVRYKPDAVIKRTFATMKWGFLPVAPHTTTIHIRLLYRLVHRGIGSKRSFYIFEYRNRFSNGYGTNNPIL